MPRGDQPGWFSERYARFHAAHERLKDTVHNKFRYPLPPWGRAIMGGVYFSIPILLGAAIMNYYIIPKNQQQRQKFLKATERREKEGIVSYGNEREVYDPDTNTVRLERVGAGGWGRGVQLATSDVDTQEVNRINVERFLRKERRKKERREKEEREAQNP